MIEARIATISILLGFVHFLGGEFEMNPSFSKQWIRRFRIAMIGLIFSGALNIGFVATLLTMRFEDSEKILGAMPSKLLEKAEETTNRSLLLSYSRLSFRELCSLLTNTDLAEEGFLKRDLALAALVSFHDFNIEKTLGSASLQKRSLNLDGHNIELFAGLTEEQFRAILRYAYLERWPLTGRGLFVAMQKSTKPRDEALVQAFSLTPEFYYFKALFQKSEVSFPLELIIELACSGTWQMLNGFMREQMQMQDLSDDRRRRLLLSYLALQSPAAADLFLQTDGLFALKRLDDRGVIDLISHAQMNDVLHGFCIELLKSSRSDAVYEKSAEILCRMANIEMTRPVNRAEICARFLPQSAPVITEVKKDTPLIKVGASHRTYVVREGDNLWKIARQHHVDVKELASINHLEKGLIRPGTKLLIPALRSEVVK
jgi:LysM repeat protein